MIKYIVGIGILLFLVLISLAFIFPGSVHYEIDFTLKNARPNYESIRIDLKRFVEKDGFNCDNPDFNITRETPEKNLRMVCFGDKGELGIEVMSKDILIRYYTSETYPMFYMVTGYEPKQYFVDTKESLKVFIRKYSDKFNIIENEIVK
ncbi:hypothetical protein [Psychrobacter sp. I-STPA10]|uniref:hypothetical protein n=1 Tax=Psychrobacter sp. I-STPA10 TaxID=2585769 RepID=UPI001E3B92A4|nr:hypothetical protein [Psychrobacter sp. I-STPA10]